MNEDGGRRFRLQARRIGMAWLALLALLMTSFGSAYLPLGALNVVIGIGIAAVKSAIVLWLFMRLPSGDVLPRVAAAVAVATLALLFALAAVDVVTRPADPAPVQPVVRAGRVPRKRSWPRCRSGG